MPYRRLASERPISINQVGLRQTPGILIWNSNGNIFRGVGRLVQVGIVPDWRSRARPDRHPGTHSICADHNRDAFPIAGYSWKEPKQMQMLPRPPAEAGPETARNALVAPRGPVDAGSWNLKTAKARPCPARSHCPLCWPGKDRPKPGLHPSPQRRPLRPPS